MLAPIFVVILTVIYVKYLKVEVSLKVRCDQEVREDFWIFHLDALHPQGSNQRRTLEY